MVQKAIGYVRTRRSGDPSTELQKHMIQSYCEDCGYELISHYETSTPLAPEQLDELEEFIREQIGAHDTTVKLIPTKMSRIGRDISAVQSVIIVLRDKRIEIEPVAAFDRNLANMSFDADNDIYGYKKDNGKLVIDMIEAENIKWMFHMVLQYTEHPPVSLVEAVIESAAEHGEIISYEEAENRVSYDAILHYMGYELNLKNRIFMHGTIKTPEALQEILSLSLEKAKEQYAEPAEATVAESVAWTCRINQVLPKPSFYQPSPLCEPIISTETYSAVQQAVQSKLSL